MFGQNLNLLSVSLSVSKAIFGRYILSLVAKAETKHGHSHAVCELYCIRGSQCHCQAGEQDV